MRFPKWGLKRRSASVDLRICPSVGKSAEHEDALEVGEQHLDALAVATRALECLGVDVGWRGMGVRRRLGMITRQYRAEITSSSGNGPICEALGLIVEC